MNLYPTSVSGYRRQSDYVIIYREIFQCSSMCLATEHSCVKGDSSNSPQGCEGEDNGEDFMQVFQHLNKSSIALLTHSSIFHFQTNGLLFTRGDTIHTPAGLFSAVHEWQYATHNSRIIVCNRVIRHCNNFVIEVLTETNFKNRTDSIS